MRNSVAKKLRKQAVGSEQTTYVLTNKMRKDVKTGRTFYNGTPEVVSINVAVVRLSSACKRSHSKALKRDYYAN